MPHVFVGVNDDAQVHAIDGHDFVIDRDLALIVSRLQLGASRGYRIE